jgi:Domain of unknown function (DUF4350)
MPGVSSGDRKILRITAAAFVALVVLGFLLAPSNTETETASTYSTASGGAKAAYLLLQELGYHVERWEKPSSELKPDNHTVLVIADAAVLPDAKQKAAIEKFIAGGGRVITTGIEGAMFLPKNSSEFNPEPKGLSKEYDALTPSPITRAAPKMTLIPFASWSKSTAIPLYGSKDDVYAAQYVHGQGDAIWLASATPFTNAGIQATGNLEFLLAAIGDKQQTRVLFDEYVHGYGERGTPEKNHPLTMALLLQSALLALAALLTFSRRSGPLRPVPPPSRLTPLEFVETLGGLYQQAHAASVAVDVYYQRFQYWVTRRLGLNKNATSEEIARAVRERWDMKDDAFLDALIAAASARYQPDLPQKQALDVVQKLHEYAVQFKLFPKEKI